MIEINGVEFISDNKEAVKVLKREGIYGTFLAILKEIPEDKPYIVMSDKNNKRNLYCQYFREKDEFGQSGYSITVIRNPLMKLEQVKVIEEKIINNFDGKVYRLI